MSDELYVTAGALGMKDSAIKAMQSSNGKTFDADEYAQFLKLIYLCDIVDRSIKSMKSVDLEIDKTICTTYRFYDGLIIADNL